MSVIKNYSNDLPGKTAKWKDQLLTRINSDFRSRISIYEANFKNIFTDESGTGGPTIQQKFDSLGADAASLMAASNAVKVCILAIDPTYVSPTPADMGYSIAINPGGTVTVSAL